MREIPDYLWEWTEIDFNTGNRLMKNDTPEDIRRKIIEDEKDFFRKTGRRCIDNIDIEENSDED
ncbi:MAG: hypothetical protein NC040_09545 [Muribaculaceae bacterium]|nr:hypothetical protein [Alistipes senegalensis]MCM1474293.1 hypothetical protein [Muribaculaceae bacterium]